MRETKKNPQLINEHFRKRLGPNISHAMQEHPPTKMLISFSADEIEKAVKRLKGGKNTGIEEIHAE